MTRDQGPPLPGFMLALSDDDFLDVLGPSWELMSPAEREAYGQPGRPAEPEPTEPERVPRSKRLRLDRPEAP